MIAGHLFSIGGTAVTVIFTFHMPLFFIISGILFKPEKDTKLYIKNKLKHLGIPYLFYLFLGFCFTMLVPELRSRITLRDIILNLYWGKPDCFHMGQLWFITVLLDVQIGFCFFEKYIIPKGRKVYLPIILVLAVLTQGLYDFSFYLPSTRGFLLLDVAVIAFLFYYFGYELAHGLSDAYQKWKSKPTIYVIMAMLVIVFSMVCRLNGDVNIVEDSIGNAVLYYPIAVIGSMMVILFSELVSKCAFLAYWGKNSMTFFALQSIFIFLYAKILTRLLGYEVIPMRNIPNHLCVAGTIIIILVILPFVVLKNRLIRKKDVSEMVCLRQDDDVISKK